MSQHTGQPTPTHQPNAPTSLLSRRKLFAGASAVGAAAAAVAVLPALHTADAVPAESAKDQPMPAKGGGYTLSERVKQYYNTTRI